MRIVTACHAVKAMVLNGLGFLNQQRYLVPNLFQHKPIARLLAPGMQASHLNDDTLGRALNTLYECGGDGTLQPHCCHGGHTFGAGLQTTCLHDSTVCPTPHDGKRGRPGAGAPPDHLVYHSAGALVARRTGRQARIDHHSCCILATNELDEGQLSSPAVLDGYKGHARAERGFRCLKAPQCLASALSRKNSERIMAL